MEYSNGSLDSWHKNARRRMLPSPEATGAGNAREGQLEEAETSQRDTIGMTAEEMHAYLEALLQAEAAEAAAARGTTVEEELDSVGFAAARAATSYAIKLIDANNAYIARYLLDRGVFNEGGPDRGG